VTVFKKNVDEGRLQLSTKKSTIDWAKAHTVAVDEIVEGVVDHIVERTVERAVEGKSEPVLERFQSSLLVKLSGE